MNRFGIASVVTLSVAAVVLPGPSRASSLTEAIRKGIAKSPVVKEAIAEASGSFAEINEVRANRRPQVEFESTWGAAFRDRSIDGIQTGTGETLLSRDARLTIQQIIFDFGASEALVESADLRNQFHALLVEDTREEQALTIAETYLQLYLLRLQSRAVRKHIRELADLRDRAEASEDAEGETPAIVIQGRLVNMKSKLAQFDARIDALSSRFELLTTMRADGSMSLGRLPSSLKEKVSVYESPRVRAAELAIRSSEKNVTAARRDVLPKLYFEGRGGVGENVLGIEGSDDEWAALAVVRWPLYQGGRKKAVIDKQLAALEKDLAAKERVIQAIVDEVSVAQAELNGAVERQRQSRQGAAELRDARDRYEESLDAGSKNVGLLNLVSTAQEILNSDLEAYSAMADSYLSSARGMTAAGQFLEYLGIDDSRPGK